MSAKEPTVQVPVSTFLTLARIYKEQPQEVGMAAEYLQVTRIESIAYRKHTEYRRDRRAEEVRK